MKVVRARQAAAILLLGCLVFSLVMFVGVNRNSELQRSDLRIVPDGDGGGQSSAGNRFALGPRMRAWLEGKKEGEQEGRKFDGEKRKVVRSFSNANGKNPAFLKAVGSAISNRAKNKTSTEKGKKKRKKMPRYLIEYSSFQNNEQLREGALVVADRPSGANRSVWFHAELDDDGIVAQLDFLPPSYAEKLHRLNLMRLRKGRGWRERKDKLDRFLKGELKMIRQGKSSGAGNSSTFDGAGGRRQPDWNGLLKIVYLPEGLPSYDFVGRETLSSEGCPVSACHLTDDPLFKDLAHARVFQNIPVTSEAKPAGQLWVLWLLESPVNTFIINDLDVPINWTATFRRDSTVVTPYAKYLHGDGEGPEGEEEPPADGIRGQRKRSYATGKSKMVAWFASNCYTTNNRMEFVAELSKFVQVDVFGRCGHLECSKDSKDRCYKMLSDDYKFYLALENSNCDSYITEKLFENAFGNNVVPIVMGARRQDYERSSPPNSFIHVDDFRSVEELADYLKLLDRNDTLYDGYMAWKGQGRFIDTKFWCRVCAMLQDDEKPSMWYEDIESWWKHYGTCRVGRWTMGDEPRTGSGRLGVLPEEAKI